MTNFNHIDYSYWDKWRILGKRLIRRKPSYKKFSGRLFSLEQSCLLLADAISSCSPFMLAKFGESELEVLRNAYAIQRIKGKNKFQIILDYLKFGDRYEWTGLNTLVKDSGFFPYDSSLLTRFALLYFESIEEIDFFATSYGLPGWYSNKGEDYILKWVGVHPKIITTDCFGIPMPIHRTWTEKLRDKNVLVIHPFEQTIKRNYLNREKLFPFELLPEFNLKTIKAVQSVAFTKTPYENWFDALKSMQSQIDQVQFDIALLGCGAYGLPLAAYIKGKGKQAIHFGGGLQLYFGIRGNRWDNHPVLKEYFNEYWTRPVSEEIPENFGLVGDGSKAYW